MTGSQEMPEGQAGGTESGGLYDGFEAYRTATDADYRRLLTGGLVVPDTNVLLNLYRYNQQTRTDLFTVLRGLGEHLWVPRQVMTEFWRNREAVLRDPRDVGRTVEQLTAQRDGSVNIFRSWANRVRLSPERGDQLAGTLTAAFGAVMDAVRTLDDDDAHRFAADTAADPVLAGLEAILHGRVGTGLGQAEHAQALEEARRRADVKQPPGYKDAGKPGTGAAGDYLLWVQTLREAQRRRQDVLLVTGDVKEDWWRREHGELRGPRLELADELRTVAGVGLFMLRPESLLLRARQVFQLDIRDESVQDVERVAEAEAAGADEPVTIGDDHPMWSLHSGGSRHEAPDWRPGDGPLAQTQDQLPQLTAVFHRALVDRPGQLLSVEDLAEITNGELLNSRVIAGALSGYVGWCERLDRRFPFYWWEGRDGESTRYAMPPRVAALFRAARRPS